MLDELTAMQLYCRRLADLETTGGLRPTQASLAKYHNTRAARRVAAIARDLLAAAGLDSGAIDERADDVITAACALYDELAPVDLSPRLAPGVSWSSLVMPPR